MEIDVDAAVVVEDDDVVVVVDAIRFRGFSSKAEVRLFG